MVAEIKVDLKGIKEVEEVLKEAGSLKPFKSGLKAGAFYLKGKFASYPKQRPPVDPRRIYVRGVGTKYVPTGKTYFTSERHGQSWTIQERQGGLQQAIGTDTSYAKLLQDQAEQTSYHKVTGWKTVQQTIKEETKKVVATINEAIEKAIKRLNR